MAVENIDVFISNVLCPVVEQAQPREQLDIPSLLEQEENPPSVSEIKKYLENHIIHRFAPQGNNPETLVKAWIILEDFT